MNLYFFVRILSLISMILGSFLVTFSIWTIYVRYCSLYHTVLHVTPSFIDYFMPRYYDCASTEWSEWSSCNKTKSSSERFRKNAACKEIIDTKPCLCPIADLCDVITLEVNNKMDDCIESFLNSNLTDPFLIRGNNNDTQLLCSLNT